MTVKERFRRIYERFALNYQFSRKNPFGGYAGTADGLRKVYLESSGLNGKVLVSRLADRMKKESGIGGYGGRVKAGSKEINFSEEHGTKGITLRVGKCSPQGEFKYVHEFAYNWKQVAKIALEMGIFDEAR